MPCTRPSAASSSRERPSCWSRRTSPTSGRWPTPCTWSRRARSSRAGLTPSSPPTLRSSRPTSEACSAMDGTDIVGIAVTTIILGSIYGLVAIGMTLIYGTLRILDMSQGSMVMVGSFIGWGILVVAGWNPILGILLARTRWGMAIRAVAQNLDAARLMGVPVGKLYPLTMGLASALAGIAGVFLGGLYFAYPQAGDLPLLEALIVVIFGGLGSLPGTVYAAYAIGLIQATAEVIVGTTWSLPILYGVILLVLVVRPYGLLGKPSEARL